MRVQGTFDDVDFVKTITKPLLTDLEVGRLNDDQRMPNGPDRAREREEGMHARARNAHRPVRVRMRGVATNACSLSRGAVPGRVCRV